MLFEEDFVGGVLFALEEVATWWRSALLWRNFFSTAVLVVVLRGFIEICHSGKCGPFGEGGLIMFDVKKCDSEVPCYGYCHRCSHWYHRRGIGKPLQSCATQDPQTLQSHQSVSNDIQP